MLHPTSCLGKSNSILSLLNDFSESCFSALGSKALQYMEVGLSLVLSSTNVTTDRKKADQSMISFPLHI